LGYGLTGTSSTGAVEETQTLHFALTSVEQQNGIYFTHKYETHPNASDWKPEKKIYTFFDTEEKYQGLAAEGDSGGPLICDGGRLAGIYHGISAIRGTETGAIVVASQNWINIVPYAGWIDTILRENGF